MGFLNNPLSKQKTAIWRTEDMPASVLEDMAKVSPPQARRGPRRTSIAPPRRGGLDAEEHDTIIMEHLSGARDAFEDASAFMLDDVMKSTLSDVQKTSRFFRGFSDADIDAMFPFLTHFPYHDGDLLAQEGEPATWCGILLTGEIEAVEDPEQGGIVRVLKPGTIVGEMSLFRGGARYCDLVGRGNGALAALLFDDLPALYAAAPLVAHRLVSCFGRSATCKLVQPHPLPGGPALAVDSLSTSPGAAATMLAAAAGGGSVSKKRGLLTAADPSMRLRVVSQALQRRGLTEEDSAELLKIMVVEDVSPNQVIMQESRALNHVGVVLQGSVVEGEVSKGAGELVGAWFALSGHPVHLRVVSGSQGASIGCIALDRIGELATSHGELALKTLRAIGIGATAQAEERGEDDAASVATSLGAKMTEVLYRNKIKDVEAKASVMQDEAGRALHDKQRNAILLKKVQRAHTDLASKMTNMQEQLEAMRAEKEKVERVVRAKDQEIAALNSTADGLRHQLQMSQDEKALNEEMMSLRDKTAAKDVIIGELRDSLEKMKTEREELRESFAADFRQLQEQSAELHNKTVTQFRWRCFILLILLDRKRRVERRVKTRNKVVEWLSGKQTADAALSLEAVRGELNDTKSQLREMSAESSALREAAAEIAQAKAHLEQQQALVRTTREALGRDEQLEGAARAAE